MTLSTLLILGGLGFSCGDFVTGDEVARVPSPSREIDAVLVESNGGATMSFWYDVYLVDSGAHWRSGEHVAYLYGAVRSRHAYGANLRWQNPTTLAVDYLEARESKLHRSTVHDHSGAWRILLNAGQLDSSAPSGGMLYNLQGRPHDPK